MLTSMECPSELRLGSIFGQWLLACTQAVNMRWTRFFCQPRDCRSINKRTNTTQELHLREANNHRTERPNLKTSKWPLWGAVWTADGGRTDLHRRPKCSSCIPRGAGGSGANLWPSVSRGCWTARTWRWTSSRVPARTRSCRLFARKTKPQASSERKAALGQQVNHRWEFSQCIIISQSAGALYVRSTLFQALQSTRQWQCCNKRREKKRIYSLPQLEELEKLSTQTWQLTSPLRETQ